MNYREYAKTLSRMNQEDFQDAGSQVHLGAVGASADDLVTRATTAMLARLILMAPEDALELTGRERGLPRYPGEYLSAFRNRLLNAWDYWAQAGTLPGMYHALAALGYATTLGALDGNTARGIFRVVRGGVILQQAEGGQVQSGNRTYHVDGDAFVLPTLTVPGDYRYYSLPPSHITEHWQSDRTIWAEFSVYLTPTVPDFTADSWDDGSRWDDDTLWDLTITQAEIDRVRAVLNEIKPAHARLRALYLNSTFQQDFWDDGSLWDDGSVWDAAAPKLLYLRPGV